MSNLKNNRISLYFSPKRDEDLIEEMKDIESGDVSWFIKNLMRDGLKHRSVSKTVDPSKNSRVVPPVVVPEPTVKQEPSKEKADHITDDDLMDIEIEEKEMSDEDIEDKFDNL